MSRLHATNLRAFSLRGIALPVLAALSAFALAGCSVIGGPKEPTTLYAPEPKIDPDPAWPAVDWTLATTRPVEGRVMDGLRIVVSPVPGELQVYRSASWARSPAEMVEDTLLRTLEESGKIRGVARQGSGIAADYRLLMEIRNFRSDYAGNAMPAALIDINAKLLHASDQTIVATRNFNARAPASGIEVAQVADAFAQALAPLARDIAGWTLAEGQRHQQEAHVKPARR